METHIGVGVGKYIEKEFDNAKKSLYIATPTLTQNFAQKLISMVESGIQIKIITSSRINPETELSNVMLRKYIRNRQGSSEMAQISQKIVSQKEIPMIHVKLYIVDDECAILGSVNLGENHFWKYAEYVWIIREPDLVNIAINDYEKLWAICNDSEIEMSATKRSLKDKIRKIKRKLKC